MGEFDERSGGSGPGIGDEGVRIRILSFSSFSLLFGFILNSGGGCSL